MPQFFLRARVFFDRDANARAFEYLKNLGFKRIAFLVDSNIKDREVFVRLAADYKKEGFSISSIEPFKVLAEPTYDNLDKISGRFRNMGLDAMIAVGGGSILDIAKGICILLKNPGKAIEYRGMDKVKNPPVPLVCCPSTAGTGSEVTHTASFIDSGSKTKLGINGNNVSALFAVLMPELTFSCPRNVTISSGLDAMVHAIEAVTAKTANQITVMLGSQAFVLLYNNFKKVLSEPDNFTARQGMLLGSYYAAIAMMNAGGGPASGISYPLGVHFGVPHGLAGGIFLRHIFEYNVSKGYMGYIAPYNYLTDADLSLNDKKKSIDFVAKFNKLYKEIGAPETLRDFGVDKSPIEFLTDLTIEQRQANLELNPVPFGKKEVVNLLGKVI